MIQQVNPPEGFIIYTHRIKLTYIDSLPLLPQAWTVDMSAVTFVLLRFVPFGF